MNEGTPVASFTPADSCKRMPVGSVRMPDGACGVRSPRPPGRFSCRPSLRANTRNHGRAELSFLFLEVIQA